MPSVTARQFDSAPIYRSRHLRFGLLGLILALPLATLATAAPATSERATDAVALGSATLPSAAQIASKLVETESSTGLSDEIKAKLIELYRRSQSNLEEASNLDKKAAEFSRSLKTAPPETAKTLKALDKGQSGAANHIATTPEALSSEELSQRLNKIQADATVEDTRVGELEKLIDNNTSRPTMARARMTEVKQTLDQLDEDLHQQPVVGESPDLAQARRWSLETRRAALWSEGRMLEQELLSQSVRDALLKARRDQAARELVGLKASQRILEERQDQQRTAEAEAAQRASQQAQREAENKHPLVRDLIQHNAEITDSLGQLAQQLDGLSDTLVGIEAEYKRVEEDYRGSKQRIEAAGLSKTLGQVLLDRRNQLPDPRHYRKAIDAREDEIAEASLRQIRYREEERHLRDFDRYLNDLTANHASAHDPLIRRQIAEALKKRKSLIAQTLSMEDDYIRQLGELNYAAEQVAQVAEDYDDFLSERLLWVRNAPAVELDTITALPAALTWILSADGWLEVGHVLARGIQRSFLFWIGLASVALLFWKVSAMRRAIRALAEPLRRVRTDRLRFTLSAIGLTLLAALPLPLLFWLLGQLLQASADATPFTRAFGKALNDVSFGLYYLRAFRMLCITGGVADRHFRWSTDTLKRARRDFDWFTLYIIPVALILVAVYTNNDPAQTGSLGRLLLVASMLGFSVFFARLLHPSQGILKRIIAEQPNGWLSRLRHLWFPLIVGAPLTLAGLALFGYVYTAGVLFTSLVYQTWLSLALVILHQTIVRWLIVTRRRLALQAAFDRQAARRAQAEAERIEGGGASEVIPMEETEPDLAALDEQTRRLINAVIFFGTLIGLWLTWSDVLPAFSLLDRFALWHYTGMIDGREAPIPVTAADVILVLTITVVAAIAAKNLPALMEILLLQSSSVSAGGRYAIKTLSSYLITATAFLLVFSTLGLSWSQVQWLVAALSVGIGFGLQEIIANFISGIIILFERPVRVGDIVTIGDTTGVVTNIRIRATTIRNWDKQELLVPNKEFITGRLLNWSLTDQQNRITIPIGIEYGSDTKKALALLTEIAGQHERVLADPAPLVSFESFGDNALTVALRCYLDSLDGRIGVVTDLHQAIYEVFARNGLAMAFPQRDVHLSTREPLNIRLQREPRDLSP